MLSSRLSRATAHGSKRLKLSALALADAASVSALYSRHATSSRALATAGPSTFTRPLDASPSFGSHSTSSLPPRRRLAHAPNAYSPPTAGLRSPSSLHRRAFHATSRRDAIPLIPAALGILKSTSVLAAVTAFSRILISFVPIGTLATFRMAKMIRWISDTVEPDASPEAIEFWKMWCEGERAKRLTYEEGRMLLQGELLDDHSMRGADGRVAVPMPKPSSRDFHSKDWHTTWEDPRKAKNRWSGKEDERFKVKVVQHTRFFLPALPPASIPYYEALDPTVRNEVDQLRRHWTGVEFFRQGLRRARWVVFTILFLPLLLLTGTYLFGLERTPLTGRWRLILLTPEEEDQISSSLAGPNWYRSVINLLTTPERPAPPLVAYDDWRWRWVQGVLRQLEAAAVQESKAKPGEVPRPIDGAAYSDPPVPPVAHALRPRPRMSSMIHGLLPGGTPKTGKEHLELGPPYALMLLQKDERNAFSYGFGGKGAGGVVVYSGLLDDILRSHPAPPAPPVEKGWLEIIFGTTPARQIPIPTEEQTLHLASVLGHEMGHLLLSHHLETLSQQQVLWPSVLGLAMDLTRAFIWPFTIFLGPTVNDALANVGRTSTEEISERYGHIGFQWRHEYEADLAGLRLLALAGFDPHKALPHFASSVTDLQEIQPPETDKDKKGGILSGTLFKLWTESTHPDPASRVKAIEEELKRWDEENKQREAAAEV